MLLPIGVNEIQIVKTLLDYWIIGKSGDYCKISNQVVIIIEKSLQ